MVGVGGVVGRVAGTSLGYMFGNVPGMPAGYRFGAHYGDEYDRPRKRVTVRSAKYNDVGSNPSPRVVGSAKGRITGSSG